RGGCQPKKDLSLIGTKGLIEFPDFFAWKAENYYLLKKAGKEEKIKLETGPQYQLEVEAFAESIIKEQELPLKVETESFANLKVMDALRKSAASEQIIKI
ncbi:MAG: Gfo/Idh/MocA family protein, partial [Bacillota bacterium]